MCKDQFKIDSIILLDFILWYLFPFCWIFLERNYSRHSLKLLDILIVSTLRSCHHF